MEHATCAVLEQHQSSKDPFRSGRPSKPLTWTVLNVVAVGMALPFSPLANPPGFVPLPGSYFIVVTSGTYLVCVELIKRCLLRKV